MNKLTDDITNTLDSNKTFTHISTIVKELIENSIDAKASQIQILIIESGLTLIEIKDNGTGMNTNTLSNLCKRFSSTKISTYSDLSQLETFGFRGEALSILSYISTLTIISRDRLSDLGNEAVYRNGKNVSMKVIPCEVGTCVKVENIFYNNLIRKKSYEKNKLIEMEDIISTISKIAFHYINIAFQLSSGNGFNKILYTNGNNDNESPLEIRKRLGAKLFKQNLNDELFEFDNYTESDNISEKNIKSINEKFKFECYYTKPSAALQRQKLILFVNNRLVKNTLIQKLFDQTYSKFLIKKGNYFAYLSITCPPEMIDVNVTANKSMIFFLNEDKIFEHFQNLLEEQLQEEINSKNYYIGSYKGFEPKEETPLIFDKEKSDKKIYAKDKVRVDNNTMSIERFISLNKINSKRKEKINNENISHNEIFESIYKNIYEESETSASHELLTKILKENYLVGYDNTTSTLFLQYQTSLYIINAKFLLDEYFLYLILSNSTHYIETINIKQSSYSVNDIFNFVYDNFPEKREIITEMRNNSNVIDDIISKEINTYTDGMIEYEGIYIKKVRVINFFTNKNFIENFIAYLPMIYYSIIERLFKERNANNIQCNVNKNLNLIVDVVKIYSHYLSNAYIEYINKQNEDFMTNFYRDVIFYNIKQDSRFKIRKNVKIEQICEKIIDTETLYTVFERC